MYKVLGLIPSTVKKGRTRRQRKPDDPRKRRTAREGL